MRIVHRYSVGDCEMRPHDSGSWMTVAQFLEIIKWLQEDDNAGAILEKIITLETELEAKT